MNIKPPLGDLELYLRDLQQYPALSLEEVADLCRRAGAGETAAREQLVLSHLSLVVRIAYGYAGYGLPFSDLVSEGNLGLLRAAELFDPTYEVAFATYASVWIRQRIHRAITAQAQVVRIPVWRSQRLRKLDRLHHDLNAELGCDASLTQLADRLGLTETDLSGIAADRVRVQSLDELRTDGTPLEERADEAQSPPYEHLSRAELQEEIVAALHGLDDTELQVLSRKFGFFNEDPESFREMAPSFGRSREWIRRIGEGALTKVAEALQAAGNLPRSVVRNRREKARRRLESLAQKKNEATPTQLEYPTLKGLVPPSAESQRGAEKATPKVPAAGNFKTLPAKTKPRLARILKTVNAVHLSQVFTAEFVGPSVSRIL